MEKRIVKAYEEVFRNFRQVDNDEFIAKESIQMTMLRMLINPISEEILNPNRFIISSSRYMSREIKRASRGFGGMNTFYESETGVKSFDEDGEVSEYEYALSHKDLGQISSLSDSYVINDIKSLVGDDYDFMIDHIDFADGSRLRGITGKSSRPKIFDSDAERYRMAYIRKKIKKVFKYGS